MSSIIDNGTEFEFYNGIELVKTIDKNLLSIRTDGRNIIEFMESGKVVWYVYYSEMTSPTSTGIMDLMSILSGYLGLPSNYELLKDSTGTTIVDSLGNNIYVLKI